MLNVALKQGEKLMKKITALLLCVALLCAFLCGCAPKTKELKDGDEVVAIIPSSDFVGKPLIEYMRNLKEQGQLVFTEQNSDYGAYIVSVNEISGDNSHYWAVYTDDADNSDENNRVLYKGKSCGYALSGVSSLVVKKDCVYILVYESFY